jgi:hypothetical protein
MLAKCRTPETCADGRELCEFCDQTVRYLKGLPYAHRDRAADLGTFVHAAIEAYILGKPFPTWPPTVKSRMVRFIQFLSDYKPEFEATEASVYNRTERYAGTLDAIATLGNRKLLLDVKTGKGVYPEVALQLAAYRYAEFIGLPNGDEEMMPEVDGCAVIHLPETPGYDLIEMRADEDVFLAFRYCREVFRWQEETSKTVLLGTPHDIALAASVGKAAD